MRFWQIFAKKQVFREIVGFFFKKNPFIKKCGTVTKPNHKKISWGNLTCNIRQIYFGILVLGLHSYCRDNVK